MSHIDELFREIKDDEMIETENLMEKDKQQRIENMIMAGIREDNTLKVISKKKVSKRKIVVFLIAATFLLGVTGYASEKNNWDREILSYMGLGNADKVQLKDSVVDIGVSSTSNGVTMKATTSVGDKNSVYIRIDTDYKLPKNFNTKTDYIVTDDFDIKITKKLNEISINYGATFNYFDNNGYLSFMFYISDCKGINQKNIKIALSDLYIYHDLGAKEEGKVDHGTLLLTGDWTLSWKYHYPSNVSTYHMLKKVISHGDTCFVTKLEISPITIRAEAIKNPMQGKTETSMLSINKITMKDGSVIEFDSGGGSGGCSNNTFLNSYRDVIEMGQAIDPSQIASITIGDSEIKIN